MQSSLSTLHVSKGLGKQFFRLFLVLALFPLILVSIVSYYYAREDLILSTTHSLIAIIELKKNYIQSFFDERVRDLELQSGLSQTVLFFSELDRLHQDMAISGKEFASHPRRLELSDRFRPDLQRFVEKYGYHDLFLIDPEGVVLFAVNDEKTLGASIFNGELAGTLLGKASRKAIATGSTVFADLEVDHTVGHTNDSFLVRPMMNDRGNRIGLIVLEISLAQIDRLLQDRTGMGVSGETFLVGGDMLMRSDSWKEKEQTALHVTINTLPVKTWLAAGQATDGERVAPGQHFELVRNYPNHRGTMVFGAINTLENLEKFGLHWAVLAEIDETEAMAMVNQLRFIVGLLLAGTFVGVALVAVLFTRRIVAPIKKLSNWAGLVAQGDLSLLTGSFPENEIGELHASFSYMVLKLKEMNEVNHKALAETQRLAEYLDNLPTPVLSVDRNFKIVYINKAGAAFASLDRTSCLGRQCYDIFNNGHCRTPQCRISQAMREKEVRTAETVIDPLGRNFPIRYTGAPVFDSKGEVVGALEYIVDISESKQALKIIEKENWIQSGIALVNDRLRGEQEIGQLCDNLLSGLAIYLPVRAAVAYVVEGGILEPCGSYSASGGSAGLKRFAFGEGLAGQAAKEKKPMLISDIPEDCVRLVSGMLEVAPRQLVVLPLLLEDRVKGVLELGSMKCFSDDDLAFLSRVAAHIAIAINTAQARVQMARLLIETQRQARELQSQQEELRVTNEELEAQTHSLKEREVELQAQHEELMTLNEELEEKTQALEKQKVNVERKNRDLEEAQRVIEKKAEELAIASKYKSEFMANMSHELRTPLNSLLLLSNNLSQNKEGNLSADQVESAKVMYSSGNDLLALINEILDLSKIEAGRINLAVTDFTLREVAGRLRNHFHAITADKGIEWSVIVSPQAPEVITTDQQRLEQILKNLIANAIKFTEKGKVSVTLRPLASDDAPSVKGLVPGEALAVTVTDTGIGIPLDKQKIIFEAFQQADGSTARKYGGTGLGLSISRELANLLGGEIQLKSEPGIGSTFTLYLPLAIAQPAGEKAALPSAPPPVRSQAVSQKPRSEQLSSQPAMTDDRNQIEKGDKVMLIIEDDTNFVKILIRQGHEKGFKCLASITGQGGLGLAEAYRPGAIILDINLPDMNGWEVLDALKKNPLLRHIPVHMMSVEEKTLDAYKKGAVGYLHKPVSQDELQGAFNRLEDFIAKEIRDLLVVEDDQILRREIVKLIGNGDVHTTAVASGTEVIALLRDKKFDCMILDLGLPDMTGFELLDKLENEEGVEIPPVIVYTGRELTKEEHESLYRYTDSIIIKGVKSAERLLDETALFLHRVVARMPDDKQKMIANLYEQDAMFIGKKILIVDDDMRNAFALSKILSEKRMEIHIANTGFKALEILEKEQEMDLVLMDIMMPEMDGYEAMRRIRVREKYWNLPIIALTAKAMPEDRGKCLEAGASDYLAKPIETARLFSMMRIWLYR